MRKFRGGSPFYFAGHPLVPCQVSSPNSNNEATTRCQVETVYRDVRATEARQIKTVCDRQTLKLSPHEQLALAFGLLKRKPPAMSFAE